MVEKIDDRGLRKIPSTQNRHWTEKRYNNSMLCIVTRDKNCCARITNNEILQAQLMLTNQRDAFRGQSRSPNIVPVHMLGIVSSCAIVTLSLRHAVFPIFEFKKCRDLEIPVKGQSR